MNTNLKKAFLWNTVGSTFYFAAQFLLTFAVVRIAGESVSGVLSTAMNVTNLFISLSGYGMRYYQVSDTKHLYSDNTYIKSRFLTCGAAAFLCLVFSFAVQYSAYQRICIMLWLLYRMSEPFSDVYNGICQQNNCLDKVGKSYAVRAVLTIAPFILLLLLTNDLAITLLAMAVLVWIVVLFYDIPQANLLKQNNAQTAETKVKLLLIALAPLAIYKALETAAAVIPKFFLERVLGTDVMGIYSPVTSPVLLLQTGASFILVPLVTVFAENLSAKNKKGFNSVLIKSFAFVAALLPVGLLVCVFFGDFGLRIIRSGLDQYSYLLPPMVVAAVLTSATMFLSMILTVLRELKVLIAANLSGLLVAALISVPMIKTFNMQGATYALIVVLLVQGAIMAFFLAKSVKKQFE